MQVNVLEATKRVKMAQWGIELTFQFPSQMLHVNILAGAILKFIKLHTYGTDPVHLEFHKVQRLGWYYHLGNDGMKEEKNCLLKI